MVTLAIPDEQVVQLVKQLNPQTKLRVLTDLTAERDDWWQTTAREGEADLRRLATGRGLSWDALSEAEREAFVGDLLHERLHGPAAGKMKAWRAVDCVEPAEPFPATAPPLSPSHD